MAIEMVPNASTCSANTVLVVEDDALLALSIEDVLRNAGVMDVAVCPTVALAMEELERKQPDAIILDVHLDDSADGWALANYGRTSSLTHCYGMIGVARDLAPSTGSGAELYAVISHAPRALDRNIALVGRVIEGIDALSSLERGTGKLGFYGDGQKPLPIVSARLASALPPGERPHFEYLSPASRTFAQYLHARENREPPFFTVPAGGADICNVPVPVRRKP